MPLWTPEEFEKRLERAKRAKKDSTNRIDDQLVIELMNKLGINE